MFKLVVISALVCLAASAPAPGFLHGGYGGYALPAATSYASRVDVVHSAPIVKTYAAPAVVATPVVTKTVVAAPAVSYHAPIVASYGLGGHGYGLGGDYGLGLGHGYDGLGYGYGHGW